MWQALVRILYMVVRIQIFTFLMVSSQLIHVLQSLEIVYDLETKLVCWMLIPLIILNVILNGKEKPWIRLSQRFVKSYVDPGCNFDSFARKYHTHVWYAGMW